MLYKVFEPACKLPAEIVPLSLSFAAFINPCASFSTSSIVWDPFGVDVPKVPCCFDPPYFHPFSSSLSYSAWYKLFLYSSSNSV